VLLRPNSEHKTIFLILINSSSNAKNPQCDTLALAKPEAREGEHINVAYVPPSRNRTRHETALVACPPALSTLKRKPASQLADPFCTATTPHAAFAILLARRIASGNVDKRGQNLIEEISTYFLETAWHGEEERLRADTKDQKASSRPKNFPTPR
jgi:hypothetical protein